LLDNSVLCTRHTDCRSGFCVDNVCCDTACAAGPCDGCSVLTGATASGTCTLHTGPACDDGNLCTQTDVCQNGLCERTDPISCLAPTNQCQTSGQCNPSTGECSPVQPKENGIPCDDGDMCTTQETCKAGECEGEPVTCICAECSPYACFGPERACMNPCQS